jgi:Rieske Fe-S protein
MHKRQSVCTHLFRASSKHSSLFIVATMLATIAPAIAQTAAPAGGQLQQRLAEIKQSTAANQQKLHKYQWTETTQATLKGEPKPPKQSLARYGPDGKVQKTPIGAPQPQQQQQSGRGGRLKQRVIEKKKEEFQEYGEQIKNLIALYLPPDSQKMQEAFRYDKASLSKDSGTAEILFRDYALAGDRMTLSFDTASKKISSINVQTYMDDPKDTVTLDVHFATLPDGTNYVQGTTLNATAKQLQVTTTNSNYQPLAQ